MRLPRKYLTERHMPFFLHLVAWNSDVKTGALAAIIHKRVRALPYDQQKSDRRGAWAPGNPTEVA